MSVLLHLDSSARRATSVSRQLSAYGAARWRAAHPEGTILYRDLAAEPVRHVDGAWVDAAFTPPPRRSGAQQAALAISDDLVDEFLSADTIIAGVPMYNFHVPAAFKAWIDQIVRAGRTFEIGPRGARGLAGGRRVIVVGVSQFDYGPDAPAAAANHHEPWLRTVLGFMGIPDPVVVWAITFDAATAAATASAVRDRLDREFALADAPVLR